LYAFIEGQPEYELAPKKHKFDLKVMKGYSVDLKQ
jgi:hypothetical protein